MTSRPLPWECPNHQPAETDDEGNIMCHCGVVLEGPLKDEADEFLGVLNEALQGGSPDASR